MKSARARCVCVFAALGDRCSRATSRSDATPRPAARDGASELEARAARPITRGKTRTSAVADPRRRRPERCSPRTTSTRPLNPASNAKLYTAAAALALLHGDHRYETSSRARVKGASAASLIAARFWRSVAHARKTSPRMAGELHAHGIRRVDGDIFVDQRFYDDQTTPPAFEQKPEEWAAFRAPVSAVAIDENTVTLDGASRRGGPELRTRSSSRPDSSTSTATSRRATGSGADTVGLALAKNGTRLSAKISGTVGEDAKLVRYTRRVEDPTLLAGYALKNALEQMQIKVSGEVKTGTGKGPRDREAQVRAALDAPLRARKTERQLLRGDDLQIARRASRRDDPRRAADSAQLVSKCHRGDERERRRARHQEWIRPLRRESRDDIERRRAASERVARPGDPARVRGAARDRRRRRHAP